MTHFCVLLISDTKYDMDGLYDVLWPWDFDNRNSRHPRFDFFHIGGIFQDVLDPHFNADDPPPVLVSSQKQKKDLAIKALEARKIAYFASLYDKVHAAIGDLPLPDVAALRQIYGERDWPPYFHADPAVKAARQAVPDLYSPEKLSLLRSPRHEVLDLARRLTLLTLGLIVDSQWHEFEYLDFYENPDATAAWEVFFKGHLAAAHPESWLTVLDCHC